MSTSRGLDTAVFRLRALLDYERERLGEMRHSPEYRHPEDGRIAFQRGRIQGLEDALRTTTFADKEPSR
jgi:hypothetical protein